MPGGTKNCYSYSVMDRPLSSTQARSLTDEIKASPETRWSLIAEAYNRGLWSALDYPSWEDYCAGEFGPDRLRLPWRKRREVLVYLQQAGLPFRAIESVTVRRRPNAGLPLVAGERTPGADVEAADAEAAGSRPDRQLGFTRSELSLLGSLLSVSDEEFGQVLADGHRTGSLTGPVIEAACWGASQERMSIESNLKKAIRALDRAGDLLARCHPGLTPSTAAMQDMLRGLEDRAWDVLDEVDDLRARFDTQARDDHQSDAATSPDTGPSPSEGPLPTAHQPLSG